MRVLKVNNRIKNSDVIIVCVGVILSKFNFDLVLQELINEQYFNGLFIYYWRVLVG